MIPNMSAKERETEGATEYVNDLLHEALQAGADTVELEGVPEGLEICSLVAASWIGMVLEDRAEL